MLRNQYKFDVDTTTLPLFEEKRVPAAGSGVFSAEQMLKQREEAIQKEADELKEANDVRMATVISALEKVGGPNEVATWLAKGEADLQKTIVRSGWKMILEG